MELPEVERDDAARVSVIFSHKDQKCYFKLKFEHEKSQEIKNMF